MKAWKGAGSKRDRFYLSDENSEKFEKIKISDWPSFKASIILSPLSDVGYSNSSKFLVLPLRSLPGSAGCSIQRAAFYSPDMKFVVNRKTFCVVRAI